MGTITLGVCTLSLCINGYLCFDVFLILWCVLPGMMSDKLEGSYFCVVKTTHYRCITTSRCFGQPNVVALLYLLAMESLSLLLTY